VAEYKPTPPCPDCGEEAKRIYTPPHIYGTEVEDAEFNPGLGCIVKNKKHRAEIAKRKGLVEVGNECPKKIYDNMEKDRNKKLLDSWNEV
jgi:hypothetical protein